MNILFSYCRTNGVDVRPTFTEMEGEVLGFLPNQSGPAQAVILTEEGLFVERSITDLRLNKSYTKEGEETSVRSLFNTNEDYLRHLESERLKYTTFHIYFFLNIQKPTGICIVKNARVINDIVHCNETKQPLFDWDIFQSYVDDYVLKEEPTTGSYHMKIKGLIISPAQERIPIDFEIIELPF